MNDEEKRQYEAAARATDQVRALSSMLGRQPTACVVTFGCQMNARDSEKLSGILESVGFALSESEDADLVIYNTCTVRENADNRLFGRLGAIGARKKTEPWRKLFVCGCMMQEDIHIERIKKSYPFVDLIFGTHNLFTFPSLLEAALAPENQGRLIIDVWQETKTIAERLPSKRKYPFKSGVNIMFGCDNFCTYCIVPYVRGRERSREPKDIIREMEILADQGVKEVMLLGQNVNSYGKNLETSFSFAQLLQEAEKVSGIERIRFMTPHPKDFSEDVLKVIASSEQICRHIHLPLQSGSTAILRRLHRRYTKEQFLDLALHIRDVLPDAAITTDIIVGFPGETDADVDDTIDVVRKVHFDNAFTFIYSKRTGTPAASMEQVSEADAHRNFDRLLKVVQEEARGRVKLLQGQVLPALVEEKNTAQEGYVTGRLTNNTLVHFPGDDSLIGQIVNVSLDDYQGFYYLGKQV